MLQLHQQILVFSQCKKMPNSLNNRIGCVAVSGNLAQESMIGYYTVIGTLVQVSTRGYCTVIDNLAKRSPKGNGIKDRLRKIYQDLNMCKIYNLF